MLQIKITTDNIFYYFKKISIRTVNNVPTLYKPLLILYALSKVSSRQKRLLPYSTIDKELNSIIDASFITLKHRNFHYAFGRLETDGLWEVEGQEKLKKSKSGDLEKSELIAKNIKGGFTDIVYTILRNNPKILKEIYLFFLNTYFDKSIDKILLSLSEYPVFKGRKMTLISNEGEPVSRWWIQKGISTIKTDREIFSSSNMRRARLEFIAGKNRLATIKGWMLAAQIIQNGKNSKEFELSDFGFSLFENDPKLEKSASWWAFHLSVCFSEINEPYASFFTHLDYLSKDWVTEKQIREQAIKQLEKNTGNVYKPSTMDSLLSSVRRMFIGDRPLAELGLIETRKNREQGISIRLGTPKLTDEIIIHALAMMRFHCYKSRPSIAFSELLSAGLAHYLCSSPEQLRTELRRISQTSRWNNHFVFKESINIDSISFGDDCNPKKTLLELLQKGEDTWL